MIVIKNLSKTYQHHTAVLALQNINLTIKQGSFTALLGRSGSGKTTLMNIIGCLDRATSGEYYLNQHNIQLYNVHELAAIRNKYIGFIFQHFYLLNQLNALENVALPLFYRGIDTETRLNKAQEILNTFELGNRAYHKPQELSGGQQQRVAIARSLITDPPIILADEPTGNLDSKTGQYIINLFKELNQQGKTIVLITHDHKLANSAQEKIILVDGMVSKNEQ